MGALIETLASVELRSSWAAWLAESSSVGAEQTRGFLEGAFAKLTPDQQKRVVKRLRAEAPDNIDALLYHIMAFAFCQRLGLQPEFEPQYGPQTPDLRILIGAQPFAAEVFRCSRPTSTLEPNGYCDAGETFRKIAQGISAKSNKYKSLSDPLVILALYAGNDVDHDDLERALFGSNGLPDRLDPERNCHEIWQQCGVLCPRVDGIVPHVHLSAVIGLDWFDSLNKQRRGRRLHPLIFHHWRPSVSINPLSFEPFCQIRWQQNGTSWLPVQEGIANNVIETGPTDELVCGPYSSDDPW